MKSNASKNPEEDDDYGDVMRQVFFLSFQIKSNPMKSA